MEKVVLITGASTGIGNETARLFQAKNWKVAATMRRPEDHPELGRIADLECFQLDVTDPGSVKAAIASSIDRFGRIDAVVNNAGYSVAGPFEASEPEQIERLFKTNVFGLMNVCREILPYFREQRRGIIVNVASLGGRAALPFSSLYSSTKWAVEGFSEALQFEVEQFNIRVKIIEPAAIKTDFYGRSQQVAHREGLTVYDRVAAGALEKMQEKGAAAPGPEIVAQTIYDAVTDGSKRMRYQVNSKGVLFLRGILPERVFARIMRAALMKD